MNLSNQRHVAGHLIAILKAAGHDAYIVGGAVRDKLQGKLPEDVDVATSATPEQVQYALGQFFIDTKVVGESFGVVLASGIEIATFRRDIHNGIGDKNCTVEYAKTIEEDLSRRDFTINAMALDPTRNEIIDPFCGWDDLNRKTLRFVGEPSDRILEDPNRMIRAARMMAKLGMKSGICPATLKAIVEHRDLVRTHVAPERIRLEIMKAMKLERPSLFWWWLRAFGILEIILPELDDLWDWPGGKHHKETVWEHSMLVGDAISPKFPLVRLAGYLHDIGKAPCWCPVDGNFLGHQVAGSKMAEDRLLELKFSLRETERVVTLIRMHMRSIFQSGPKAIRRLLVDLQNGHVSYCEFVRLVIADHNGNLGQTPYSFREIKKIILALEAEQINFFAANRPSDLKINGNDVMKTLDLRPGPQVGMVLRKLFGYVDEDPERNERGHLMSVLSEWNYPYDYLEAA